MVVGLKHTVAFDQVKKAMVEVPCLKIFDPKLEVTLSVDPSQYGLGAVLLQDGRPVAYGSATLTATQQRYVQIKKELLAVVYGLEHFNFYTYGRNGGGANRPQTLNRHK